MCRPACYLQQANEGLSSSCISKHRLSSQLPTFSKSQNYPGTYLAMNTKPREPLSSTENTLIASMSSVEREVYFGLSHVFGEPSDIHYGGPALHSSPELATRKPMAIGSLALSTYASLLIGGYHSGTLALF